MKEQMVSVSEERGVYRAWNKQNPPHFNVDTTSHKLVVTDGQIIASEKLFEAYLAQEIYHKQAFAYPIEGFEHEKAKVMGVQILAGQEDWYIGNENRKAQGLSIPKCFRRCDTITEIIEPDLYTSLADDGEAKKLIPDVIINKVVMAFYKDDTLHGFCTNYNY